MTFRTQSANIIPKIEKKGLNFTPWEIEEPIESINL